MADLRDPDETWSYGSDPDQVADVYLPRLAARRRSVVGIVHGGFWKPVYDREHVRPLATALADRGHLVVSLEYRRRPGEPDATTSDVLAAVTELPGLRASLGAADLPIQLIGHSAGGHLVLWLAAEPVVDATAIALAPVADLVMAERLSLGSNAVSTFLGAAAFSRPDLDPARRADPRDAVTVIHGAADTVVPISVGLAYAEPRRHVVRLVVVDDCEHHEPIDPDSEVWPILTEELDRLLDSSG